MALASEGIWVRLTMVDGTSIRGYAAGAESPNDFWSKFRTQMVRLERVRRAGDEDPDSHGTVYVNRDRIVTAEIVDGQA